MLQVRIPPEAAHFSLEKKGVVFGRSCLLCLVSLTKLTWSLAVLATTMVKAVEQCLEYCAPSRASLGRLLGMAGRTW